MRTRRALLATTSMAVALLSGCGGDESRTSAGGSGSSATSTSAGTTTSVPGDTTSVPGESSASDAGGTAEPSTSTPVASMPVASPTEAAPVHGAQRWGVYLAVGQAGDPALQQTFDEARSAGWAGASLGELGCDNGAAEALGRDRTEHAVAVYFETSDQVDAFDQVYGRPYVGAAQVTTYCLD